MGSHGLIYKLDRLRTAALGLAFGVATLAGSGCHTFEVAGKVDTDSRLTGAVQATIDMRIPPVSDPGPMVPVIVRESPAGPNAPRIAVLDVDGLLLNQNLTGLYSAGENPVAAFREKLEAAAVDPRVRAVVVRINSPGGGVAATDLMAEDLRRFRAGSGKPAVACLMDVAAGGAYYIAVGCDRVMALPTSITGAVGAIVNHANLQDAMAQLNVSVDPVKAGPMVDMGTVTAPLDDQSRRLFQEMADGFQSRFVHRITATRRGMTASDRRAILDGRIVAAPRALDLHMIDLVGYPDDAVCEAEKLVGVAGAEVVLFQRSGYPARSIYAMVPNTPLQSDLIPFSYPGLERSKLPTFLYLWQPDPTLSRLGGR